MSQVTEGIAKEYADFVKDQFRQAPPWWKPLSLQTVVYKEAQKKAGTKDKFTNRSVAFSSPEHILVDYGELADSVATNPSRYFSISGLPHTFRVGFFRGQTRPERLRWAWQHEFGTQILVGAFGWTKKKALGYYRKFTAASAVQLRGGRLFPLKLGKSDIEGKVAGDIDRFLTASRRLVAVLRRRTIAKKKVGGHAISIPERSILRMSLDVFSLGVRAKVKNALKNYLITLP